MASCSCYGCVSLPVCSCHSALRSKNDPATSVFLMALNCLSAESAVAWYVILCFGSLAVQTLLCRVTHPVLRLLKGFTRAFAGSHYPHKLRNPKARAFLRTGRRQVGPTSACICCNHICSTVKDVSLEHPNLLTNASSSSQAPRTAENFLALCASGYYDATLFHRNIKGFMIQVCTVCHEQYSTGLALL